jgi:hypothetical protein
MANRDAGSILVHEMIVLAYTQQQYLVLWSGYRPGVVGGLGRVTSVLCDPIPNVLRGDHSP